MRIVQVCPYDLARPGGVQRHVLDLAGALAEAGHEVTILAPGDAGRAAHGDESAGAAQGRPRVVGLGRFRVIHALGTGFELSWAAMSDVEHALRDARPDLVHFHTLWTPALSWQIWHALRQWPQVARVATFHDTPPGGLSGRIMRAIFGWASAWLSRDLQAAIPVSTAPAGHLRLAPGCALHILPGCIDLRAYAASATPCTLPDGKVPPADRPAGPQVLFLGRLEPRKGVLVLLRAWARVGQRNEGARLVVAGDGPLASQARELANQLGIASTVRFMGALDEAGKRDWFRRADLFCAPSLFGESYGLVLVEAMAAGVPVIAAANAGYAQVLVGAGAQGLVPPGDVDALAQRLDQWLADAQMRVQQSQWGRKACALADVHRQLPAFEGIYADALRSKLDGSGK